MNARTQWRDKSGKYEQVEGTDEEMYDQFDVSPDTSPKGPVQLAYKQWPGHNRFCCKGHLMTGPCDDWPFNTCAWLSILIPSISFFRWGAPVLWSNGGVWLVVMAAYGFVWTTGCLCLTSFTDPGYIKRQVQPEPKDQNATWRAQRTIRTSMGEQTFTWCTTCKLWRPPLSHHCSDCGHCVLGYDHHCPFVNNCVGVRNHHFFVGFLVSVVFLGFFVFFGAAVASDKAFHDGLTQKRAAEGVPLPDHAGGAALHGGTSGWVLALLIFVGALTAILCCFLGFHAYLSVSGTTTKQAMKRLRGIPAATDAAPAPYCAEPTLSQGEAEDEDEEGGRGGTGEDPSTWSGVVGYEVSKGKTQMFCMPQLVNPRALVPLRELVV